MAAAPAIMMAAGAGVGAIGAIRQGNSQGQIPDYNAQVAQQNANAAQAQASEDARRSLVNSRKQIGQGRANFGASGVTSDGSAADVLADSASTAELDALTIKNQGDIKANAYRNQASLDQFKASNARTGGYIGAVSSLLGGGGRLAAGSGGGGSSGGDD